MKNIIRYLLPIYIVGCLLSSCKGNADKNSNKIYSLQPGNKRIVIPIDDNTNCYSMSMFTYTTPDDITYLTYENKQTNELNFYRLDSCRLSHKIKIGREGPDAIGAIFGHAVIDLDNILVFTQFNLYRISRDGKIIDKYNLITDQKIILAHPPTSKVYNPMIVKDSCVYFYQALINKNDGYSGDDLIKYPLCIELNMNRNEVKTLSLTYPRLWEPKALNGIFTCSRDYDGMNFVYSFFASNSVHITNDNITFKEYPCKSQYINGDPRFDSAASDIKNQQKEYIEKASYGNIIYDKYRKVYYRFFQPACELNKDDNIADLMKTGKKFSIMILDKDFQVIGETLFPENTYIPAMFFILKDGLYMSDNNFQNPDFNENILSFRRMDLIELENK